MGPSLLRKLFFRHGILYLMYAVGFPTLLSACESQEWTCNNGDCISLNQFCDGVKDCNDSSDETTDACSKIVCSEYSFRCNYGACIDSRTKCDGIKDCIDNSDEDPGRCAGKDRENSILSQMTNIQLNLRIPAAKPSAALIFFNPNATPKSKPNNPCQLDHLPNVISRYKNRAGELSSGQYVEHASSITYKCRGQHILKGVKGNLCVNGTWYNDHPKCTPYCSTIFIIGATIKSMCQVEDAEVPCQDALVLSGRKAKISCKTGYKKPEGDFPETLTCGENGRWDRRPVACDQVCGTLEEGNNTSFLAPWYASIFRSNGNQHLCGGTVISERLILSAAHCYWNNELSKIEDKTEFIVALGKQAVLLYFGYKIYETPGRYDLSDIYIPPGYGDSAWIYNNDLAILILDKFIDFKPHIKPVCVDWELNTKEPLVPGITGRIGGWDKTDLSKTFEIEEIPVASYEDCSSATDPKNTYPFTGDKFCAKKSNETCLLESGGGFITQRQDVFYLRGIISHSINFEDVCSENAYVAITNIQFFSNIIIEYEARFRPRL